MPETQDLPSPSEVEADARDGDVLGVSISCCNCRACGHGMRNSCKGSWEPPTITAAKVRRSHSLGVDGCQRRHFTMTTLDKSRHVDLARWVSSSCLLDAGDDVNDPSADILAREIERLRAELEESNREKMKAAEYGLLVLEEKMQLQQEFDELDVQHEALTQELDTAMQVGGNICIVLRLSVCFVMALVVVSSPKVNNGFLEQSLCCCIVRRRSRGTSRLAFFFVILLAQCSTSIVLGFTKENECDKPGSCTLN